MQQLLRCCDYKTLNLTNDNVTMVCFTVQVVALSLLCLDFLPPYDASLWVLSKLVCIAIPASLASL